MEWGEWAGEEGRHVHWGERSGREAPGGAIRPLQPACPAQTWGRGPICPGDSKSAQLPKDTPQRRSWVVGDTQPQGGCRTQSSAPLGRSSMKREGAVRGVGRQHWAFSGWHFRSTGGVTGMWLPEAMLGCGSVSVQGFGWSHSGCQ